MSGPLTWGTTPTPPPPNDPAETLRRIEANTAEMVTWTKYLFGAMVALVVLLVIAFV